ncbi:hypothetical protein C7S13_3742 [Burkholderia cepacia]|nr:hypothetical protein [Burkholderia cepacia]
MRPSVANSPPPLYINSENRGHVDSTEIARDSTPQALPSHLFHAHE